MKKKFEELSIGDFFESCCRVFIKVKDPCCDCGGTGFNAVCLSKEAPGFLAYLLPEDKVDYLPNMPH